MRSHEQTYAFDNALDVQRDRLRALETLLDAGTVHTLEALGVQRGWHCLEVGAGGGSIASWLCSRVAPGGTVVATDLDAAHLREFSHANLEVRVHDVLEDDLPADEFDLVHLRLVLGWLREPSTALRRLVSALKPGGLLVAEEMDFASVAADPRMDAESGALFERVVGAHNVVLAARHSFDLAYGRRLAGDLADAGLLDLGCEGRASMWHGGQAGGRIWKLTLAQLREPIIATGLVTEADVDSVIALCDSPDLSFVSQLTMAAWGHRPPRS